MTIDDTSESLAAHVAGIDVDPTELHRAAAVLTLDERAPALVSLMRGLGDGEAVVRLRAVAALQRLDAASAPLSEALERVATSDRDARVREAALAALDARDAVGALADIAERELAARDAAQARAETPATRLRGTARQRLTASERLRAVVARLEVGEALLRALARSWPRTAAGRDRVLSAPATALFRGPLLLSAGLAASETTFFSDAREGDDPSVVLGLRVVLSRYDGRWLLIVDGLQPPAGRVLLRAVQPPAPIAVVAYSSEAGGYVLSAAEARDVRAAAGGGLEIVGARQPGADG